MNLTRLIAIGGVAAAAAVLAGLFIVAPAAAQDEQPSCADALTAYVAAQDALEGLPETIPNPAILALQGAVDTAAADVEAALPPVLTYSADVYPNGKIPALADLNQHLLNAILDNPNLGGDARAQVQAALDAVEAHTEAVAALAAAPGTVPNPARVDAQARVDAARAAADDACRGPAGPTTPAPAPTATPGGDLDCADFPLPNGRTAQQVLDADASDPNNLDTDGDRVACEQDDTDQYTQVGAALVGGVATGA